MTSKSKLSNLFKGKSVHDLPTYTTPITKHEWTKNDDKLMEAVENQNVKKVSSLLTKKNLNPTKRGPLGRSVFHVACASGNKQILDVILPRSLDVNVTTIQGNTALQWAASKGHIYTVESLLQSSANVNQRDSNEMTALHHACAGPHLSCVKVLLEGDADPHAKETGGKTPLVYAAHRGDLEICRCLLEKGADINSQDRDHRTALMLAAKEGHTDVCEFLLSQGALLDLKDGEGNTATKYFSGNANLQQVLTSFLNTSKPDTELQGAKNTQLDKEEPLLKNEIPTEIPTASKSSAKPTPHSHSKHNDLEKAYHKIKDEHEQLNEDYSALARENLKLRDKLQSSQQKLTELRERTSVETKSLKQQLSDEKEKSAQLEKNQDSEVDARDQLVNTDDNDDGLKIQDKGIEADQTLIQKLQQQVLSLESENIQLKKDLTTSPKQSLSLDVEDTSESAQLRKSPGSSETSVELQAEIVQLKKTLEEQTLAAASASESAQQQEQELRQRNSVIEDQVRTLKTEVASLQKALDQARLEGATSEAQRLDALLEKSKNIEDVNFDEEGFVEGRDMTKEEFLQGQNQQLRTQCSLLSEELEKLRTTFDAILKAGDNLQTEFDQQTSENHALHYDLELSLKEKAELASENEFLLQDNNELHESLKQLVHELERMQDKLKATQAENEELKLNIGMMNKEEDVVHLLEENNVLQQRCSDLETTSGRMQHDNGILLQEVQNLTEAIQRMTSEREQMTADLQEMELTYRQQETLRQDFTQLEQDFAELLNEKHSLEQQLAAQTDGEGSSTESAANLLQDCRELGKEKQELETIITGLSRVNVELESKVKSLQDRLTQSTSLPNGEPEKLRKDQAIEGNNNDESVASQHEIVSLKKQIAKLSTENKEWEKRYEETVNTYRTHLLSAVQGHMDPDVKDALYQIIELRSMEQFC
ncbi:ankyrin repeat domain-containing protein 24 [Elysia marginata]|uniref:Ankyrin repeat domain-containing protein 24 n=1 Tax=Elysia marginata TaxID=1093978 RepID=A0AAV4HFN9_9GAST|nr:ankyrin repeat domain-containing protein 24 [Elysia marginata]